MDVLELARWQFGVTTVYHFLFVPITLGLAPLVAILETAWVRTRNEKYLRLTKFFGTLFLINFAIGVATGIVQEFQFGMNWSDYSRFVGDVFGGPLAMEGLLAFFMESTFLGLWIFGWDKLSPAVHAAMMWIVAFGTWLSAAFILAANSFMQNPVGFEINPETGRAQLNDIWAVLTNKVFLVTMPHTIAASILTGGAFMAGIAFWKMKRGRDEERPAFRTAVRLGSVAMLLGGFGTLVTGDFQGKVMVEVQPMKMAAAEAQYDTKAPASFSILTIGTLDGSKPLFQIRVPHLLSLLSTHTLDGEVEGINDVQAEYQAEYGPGDYRPIIPLTYWTFRGMIGAGGAAMGLALLMLWATRREKVPTQKWVLPVAIAGPLLPLIGNSFGWIFTEMGRQPWVVFGLMKTADGVSPETSAWEVGITFAGFTLLYAALAVVEVKLLLRYIRAGLAEPEPADTDADSDADAPASFAY